jgi:molybdopterin converting factor small subunit
MKLRIEYMAQLRSATGRTAEEVELPAHSSLAALVAQLADACGEESRRHLLGATGQIQNGLLVVVNGAAQSAHAAAALVLQDGDHIVLLPPIAGG